MEQALSMVQRDTWTADEVDLELDESPAVAADVAEVVAQALIEREGIYWPTCPIHRRRVRATLDQGGKPTWTCQRRGAPVHSMAVIGELGLDTTGARHEGTWWRTL